VKKFVKAHKKDLDGRSKQLPQGRVGFHASTSLVVPDPEAAIEKLIEMGLEDCVRVKREVNKEALGEKDAQAILDAGCYWQPKDNFYVELDEVQMAVEPAK
jgi:phage host-nuclease inhibitor protein Gam